MKGEVTAGAAAPWGGVMFSPGDEPFSAANLSAAKELVFSTRGRRHDPGDAQYDFQLDDVR